MPGTAWGIRVPGEAWTVGLVRGALRVWLGTVGWADGHTDDIVTATVEALIHALQHAHPTRIEGGPLWLEAGVVASPGSRHVEIALRPGGATSADELPAPVRDLTAAVDVHPTDGPAWDSHVLLRSHPNP
ncbi:hypothetical protein [Pseudonocardia halophobica]|nr:hypothetical protein [Pseudonocardia halophobica]